MLALATFCPKLEPLRAANCLPDAFSLWTALLDRPCKEASTLQHEHQSE